MNLKGFEEYSNYLNESAKFYNANYYKTQYFPSIISNEYLNLLKLRTLKLSYPSIHPLIYQSICDLRQDLSDY